VCDRKDPTIVTEEIPLCGGRNREIAKYRFFLTIQDLMRKLQARKKKSVKFKKPWVHKHSSQNSL
jgi:hypothetical protein